MSVGPDRLAVLAARVTWLDRYRRLLALGAAAIVAPATIAWFIHAASARWQEIPGVALSISVGLLAWWCVEVVLAWLTAVWETEGVLLTRERRLPRATWLRHGRL